jgi:GDPmannose 4,6-dehydratase
MKALVFGSNGQDGYYLKEKCCENEVEVVPVSRSVDIIGDVSDLECVKHLVSQHRPDYIFHLAASSTTKHRALFDNHQTIATGTLNILEAAKEFAPSAKIFITGSGVQFKNTGQPINENDEFEASSPYAIARIQSVYAARYYRTLGLKIYIGYLFHHESPLRKENHLSQKIATAVSRIARGSDEILEIGDISVEKEWTFAGDVIQGIWTLMSQENIFEATIGSGSYFSVKDWLKICFDKIDRNWEEYVKVKEGFTPEYKRLVSDPSTINQLGWNPEISFTQLAQIMVTEQVKNQEIIKSL